MKFKVSEDVDAPQDLVWRQFTDFSGFEDDARGRGARVTRVGNWTQAIIDGDQAMSNFEYACPFTETLILGDVALTNPGRKLLWDATNMKITNDEEADKSMFMRRLAPRDEMGWI